MTDVVCCTDIGTTTTKTALLDLGGSFVARHQVDTAGTRAATSDRALDPQGVYAAVCTQIRTLVQKIPDANVRGICVTNQRATLLALDAEGDALAVLSWQDVRSGAGLGALTDAMDSERFHRLTGLPLSPMWPITKISWLRATHPELAARTHRWAGVHDDLLARLGAAEPLVDPSNASPTGLWDLRGGWSEPLLSLVGVSPESLPRVVPAGSPAGTLSEEAAAATGLPATTPLLVGAGDQACAALGLGVTASGQAALSLGTAADLLVPVGKTRQRPSGQIATAYPVADTVLLEGFIAAFGAALAWSRDLAGPPGDNDGDDDAQVDPDAPMFLPFLAGIATPDFEPRARGALMGLTAAHGPAEIRAAVREGLALELRRVLDANAVTRDIRELVVTGGVSTDRALLLQLGRQAGVTLVVRREVDATLRGAAAIAWAGLGEYKTIETAALALGAPPDERVDPGPRTEASDTRYRIYGRWVEALIRNANSG